MFENRWWVEVWTAPKGERYIDAHERCLEKLRERGSTERIYCGTVRSVGQVENREYKTRAGAERGAERLRAKYPTAEVEVVSGGRLA